MRTDDENKLLEPYIKALGELVVEWNDMTDGFGVLFATVLYPNEPISPIALIIWHSTRSDLAQREMLKGAATSKFNHDEAKTQRDDIRWLMDEATTLSHKRNDAIHAPLTFLRNGKGKPVDVVPSEFFGNLKAKNLGKKGALLSEYEWYTANARALKFFARQMVVAIQFPDNSWPDRPQMPTRGQKKN